jgi:hypothetical protein
LISPNRDGKPGGANGWAYGAKTAERDLFLLYFEKDCPQATLSGMLPDARYQVQWFNPRTGQWSPAGSDGILRANESGSIQLPDLPSNDDWALKLTLAK